MCGKGSVVCVGGECGVCVCVVLMRVRLSAGVPVCTSCVYHRAQYCVDTDLSRAYIYFPNQSPLVVCDFIAPNRPAP